jgi:carbon monoxide dehydrogenase subunit G
MEFTGDITIDADGATIFDLVSDPEALVTCLPGAKDVTEKSETIYTGVVERSAAGLTIELDGEVEMVDRAPPDHISMTAKGTDRITKTAMNATGEMDLVDAGDGRTRLEYAVDMEFSGKLPVHLVKSRINTDMDRFFENIHIAAEEGLEALESENDGEEEEGGLLNRFSR